MTVIVPLGASEELFNKSVELRPVHMGDTKENSVTNTILLGRSYNFFETILNEKPDVIHFQNAYNIWIAAFLPWLHRRRSKILTTFHDVEPHLGYRRTDKMIARALHIKYSHGFIVHGEREKMKLRYLGVKKACWIIPHGELSFYTRKNGTGIQEEKKVLFFGNISPYKGLTYLLSAWPLVLKEVPDARLVIAGKGDIGRNYENIHRMSSSIEVYNEFIPNDFVTELFEKSAIVVLPYVDASQSGVIPLAYAFKKPVVVTNVGSLPEAVDNEKTGLVVPPKDVESLARAITRLLNDSVLRKELGNNAHERVKEQLSWSSIAKKTIMIYKEIRELQKLGDATI